MSSAGGATGAPRVVRVIARLNVGGPALHATFLSAGLKEHYPTVLVTGVIGADEADLTDFARAQGVDVVVLPGLGREISPWRDIATLVALYRLIRKERPAIVHTHTAKAGFVGRVAALLAGVPVRVHTFHGHVLRGYFGPLKTWLFTQIERLLALTSSAVVVLSPSQARELTTELGVIPEDRVRIVPLGLELDRFSKRDNRAAGAAFRAEVKAGSSVVITCVGRMVPIKNHELLLRAFAHARASGADCVLVIVGSGSTEASAKSLAVELGIAERVRFVGWRSDLEAIYEGSDVVALSSDNEGTPVCLIEALSAARAVVSTDVGGVSDVLDKGRLGLVVPACDHVALGDAMVRLARDEAMRKQFGALGRAEIPGRFGKERLLRDIKNLYDELVAT